MARTVRTKIYKFNELSETAKQKAIENFYDINVTYDWWEFMYEDAANIGLKITSFDIDRGSYVDAEFTLSANEVAANIFRDHGEESDTYKTAQSFMNKWEPIFDNYMETEEGEDKLLKLEELFLKSLCEDYLIILRKEYEYLTSEKAIIETIEANEYEFTQDGKQF